MSKTLLLADDSVTIQKVVAISFASEDIQITTVDNGDAAVTRARELRPDVILADVVMPGKSGYEVCEAIKADPALRHIPVLLLTGTFEAFDEERARRAGAAGHVAKPFEAQALVQRVRELLTAPPAAAPAGPAPMPAAEAPSAASADDEAFAFFEEAGDAAEGESALSASELELAPGDSAFSFGDEDWSDGDDDDDDDSAPQLEPVQPVAHTVAILPDEAPADAPPSEAPPEPVLSVSPEPGPADSDSGFDFEFESVSPAPRQSPGDSFAEGAVLDPPADSGFVDPAPSLVEERPAPPSPSPEATQVLASDFEAPRSEPPAPPETGHTTDPFPDEPEAELVAPAAERQSDAATAYFEESPIPPLPVRAAEESPAPLAAPAADLSEPEPDFAAAEPLDEAPRPAASAAAEHFGDDVAGAVLAQVTPQLRDRLHETLERAAWEAFGQVTEKIVAQAVEKLEAIAWEVVPKLAETLIQEEIRKLKGDEQ